MIKEKIPGKIEGKARKAKPKTFEKVEEEVKVKGVEVEENNSSVKRIRRSLQNGKMVARVKAPTNPSALKTS